MGEYFPMSGRNKLRISAAAATAASFLLAGCTGGVGAQSKPRDGTQSSAPSNTPINTVGYDVSWPQCGMELPKKTAFEIIGLNGNIGFRPNPCFLREARWARNVPGNALAPSFYAHIQNPGKESTQVSWPAAGNTPYGNCNGKVNPACSFKYGELVADADLKLLRENKILQGARVWMDVEPEFSWQPDTLANAAAIDGMVTTLQRAGYKTGIYSSPAIWNRIAGNVPPTNKLSHLPVWLLGAESIQQAAQYCHNKSFAGAIMFVQVAAGNGGLDQDVACAQAGSR
jgi:hypothetical protein